MYRRNLFNRLKLALEDTPVVMVTGARQTGKSTLVRTLVENDVHEARYLTLDDVTVLNAAQRDPAGFVADLGGPIILDEVQRAPELFPAIKAAVDRDRSPGRFLLTGSADVMALPRLSESLAGRMEVVTLWPLSHGEIVGRRERFVDVVFGKRLTALTAELDRHEMIELVLRGGYPEVLSRSRRDRRRAWFGSYVTTILQREVRELSGVSGLSEFPRLLKLLAARVSSLANLAEISRAAAMPYNTLKRYIALLEAAFLVHRVPAWSNNLGKRLVKAPKFHLVDSGLASYLVGLSELALDDPASPFGQLLEGFVVGELGKQVAWSEVEPALYHYRTYTGHEVDIVLEAPDGGLVAIEVKAGATIGGADMRGLERFAELVGERFRRGILLYTGRESVAFGDRLHALPVEALWRLGAREQR
jgi:predicted AAA+ superfamily ATPase